MASHRIVRCVIGGVLIWLLAACTQPAGESPVASRPPATAIAQAGERIDAPPPVLATPTSAGEQAMPGSTQAVRLDNDSIVITNFTAKPLYYAIFPAETLALIEWAPCARASECSDTEIQPTQLARVQLSAVRRPATSTVTVFTWHIESQANGGGTYATQPIRADVPLP